MLKILWCSWLNILLNLIISKFWVQVSAELNKNNWETQILKLLYVSLFWNS
jgi:hypothetical protein